MFWLFRRKSVSFGTTTTTTQLLWVGVIIGINVCMYVGIKAYRFIKNIYANREWSNLIWTQRLCVNVFMYGMYPHTIIKIPFVTHTRGALPPHYAFRIIKDDSPLCSWAYLWLYANKCHKFTKNHCNKLQNSPGYSHCHHFLMKALIMKIDKTTIISN